MHPYRTTTEGRYLLTQRWLPVGKAWDGHLS
ncbi:Uncharacterised protein [Mycobacteroides abscessus subsp. abscessus]|nr:Uncharacterised protein [Mycobacteroides abscessus subsp. abscessus]SIG44332.1 Uncharacterised protein [Mycobacteroides abscessus subsp. abscessus]SIM97611.1 Uncharacterised protein [Mycobacteroides abscessus subsp. abscessus]SIN10517.1 Uncharacterised protein [Mycobacteroides abscessus subsp. abscessus]SIN15233.1 Uncharacterised protein [Mycobacteroides abscessus subsp. abscessus]